MVKVSNVTNATKVFEMNVIRESCPSEKRSFLDRSRSFHCFHDWAIDRGTNNRGNTMEEVFFRFLVRVHLGQSTTKKKRRQEVRVYSLIVNTEHPLVLRAQAEAGRIVRERMERECI